MSFFHFPLGFVSRLPKTMRTTVFTLTEVFFVTMLTVLSTSEFTNFLLVPFHIGREAWAVDIDDIVPQVRDMFGLEQADSKGIVAGVVACWREMNPALHVRFLAGADRLLGPNRDVFCFSRHCLSPSSRGMDVLVAPAGMPPPSAGALEAEAILLVGTPSPSELSAWHASRQSVFIGLTIPAMVAPSVELLSRYTATQKLGVVEAITAWLPPEAIATPAVGRYDPLLDTVYALFMLSGAPLAVAPDASFSSEEESIIMLNEAAALIFMPRAPATLDAVGHAPDGSYPGLKPELRVRLQQEAVRRGDADPGNTFGVFAGNGTLTGETTGALNVLYSAGSAFVAAPFLTARSVLLSSSPPDDHEMFEGAIDDPEPQFDSDAAIEEVCRDHCASQQCLVRGLPDEWTSPTFLRTRRPLPSFTPVVRRGEAARGHGITVPGREGGGGPEPR